MCKYSFQISNFISPGDPPPYQGGSDQHINIWLNLCDANIQNLLLLLYFSEEWKQNSATNIPLLNKMLYYILCLEHIYL